MNGAEKKVVYLDDYRESKLWPRVALLVVIVGLAIWGADAIVQHRINELRVGEPFDK